MFPTRGELVAGIIESAAQYDNNLLRRRFLAIKTV